MSREQHAAEQLREIAAFLDGSATLDGRWFGESPAGRPYWWRNPLRERVDAAIAALTASPQAAPEGGRFKVRQTQCKCHPETCCCGDYSLLLGDEVYATGSQARMLTLAANLNASHTASPQVQGGDSLLAANVKSALGKHYDPEAGIVCSVAFLAAAPHAAAPSTPSHTVRLGVGYGGAATPQRAPGVNLFPQSVSSEYVRAHGQDGDRWIRLGAAEEAARALAAPVSAVGVDGLRSLLGKIRRASVMACGGIPNQEAEGWADELSEIVAALTSGASGVDWPSNASDRAQVADLLLTDPETQEPCFVVSTLRNRPGGFMSFDVQSGPDASKWRIDVRVSESGGQDANPARYGCATLTPANADAARQAGTAPAAQDQGEGNG